MKLRKLFMAAAGLIITLASCHKEQPGEGVNNDVLSTTEMRVPEGFDYKTTKTLQFTFSTDDLWGKEKIRLDLYDFLPTAGGEKLTSFFMGGYGDVSGKLEVPVSLNEVYAVLRNPNGSSSITKVHVQGNVLSHDFSSKKNTKKVVVISPDCSTGCGTSVNNNNKWYTADNGGVYCFTGNTGGGLNIRNNSTVRICGTGSFQVTVESGGELEIVDGANVTITNFNINSGAGGVTIYPNATVNVTNWATPNGDITNHGALTFANLGINSGCDFINNGTVQVTGTGWYTVDGVLTNNASMTYTGNLTLNGNGSIVNNCTFNVDKRLTLNAIFENYSYVNLSEMLYINGNGNMKLFDGAMVEVEDIQMDGTIEGVGTTSLIKLNDNISGNTSARIKGALEFCDANGVETSFNGQFVSPAVQACNVYIPGSACNPSGNGNASMTDGDNDGVTDVNDLYPNDPLVSGASYYPSDSTYATLLFEDLWPGLGDYDFNDLVMGYRHTMVTNSTNQVVRVESRLVVKAVGGSYKNGFGWQFNVAPSAVQSITGQQLTRNLVTTNANGTEQSQSKATIVAFDNAFSTVRNKGGQYVNTITSEPLKKTDTVLIITTFTQAQDISALGDAPFNPFIFINGDRGRELHLLNNEPTDLMDNTFFGEGSDNSDPSVGQYYCSDGNHPWALNIEGNIRHMQEKIDIVRGYNYFATWAQSGGTQATDWYLNQSGYLNASKLY